ncbi:unnamed protein product [Adineta steineri]|uniref:Uncharacterized protein n=1 Tax=Adineta steineri TaxID=433720 RepID=A0A813M4H9_9BILA|nr:unnamed protein product [Adineta steineri]CAF3538725.1 unnamed protein product [Adineta steineri]
MFFFSLYAINTLFYYVDRITIPSRAFISPSYSYKSFVQGLSTTYRSNTNHKCQQIGSHASSNRTLDTLYVMILHGIEASHFIMKKNIYDYNKTRDYKINLILVDFHSKVTLELDSRHLKNKLQSTKSDDIIAEVNICMVCSAEINITIFVSSSQDTFIDQT